MDPRREIERLREEITRHDYLYYRLAQPEISDREYDKLFQRLRKLEGEHPELTTPDSPTQRVSETPSPGFKQVKHPFPLISLDNTYDETDLAEFHRRITAGLEGRAPEYFCELKFDGVAVILKFENGRFVQGATRGNGLVGDDITANLRTVRALPLRIYPRKQKVETDSLFWVRGELFMNKADFLMQEAQYTLSAFVRHADMKSLNNSDRLSQLKDSIEYHTGKYEAAQDRYNDYLDTMILNRENIAA